MYPRKINMDRNFRKWPHEYSEPVSYSVSWIKQN